jgi:hypothetical protein
VDSINKRTTRHLGIDINTRLRPFRGSSSLTGIDNSCDLAERLLYGNIATPRVLQAHITVVYTFVIYCVVVSYIVIAIYHTTVT